MAETYQKSLMQVFKLKNWRMLFFLLKMYIELNPLSDFLSFPSKGGNLSNARFTMLSNLLSIFNFNATFENVIDMINQLDIYNQVTVAIPSVVWNEMEKQIIAKHDELLLTYKNTISKNITNFLFKFMGFGKHIR